MFFARPDTNTLTLADGTTLTVKRRLNSGDARDMKAMQVYPSMAEPGLVMAYLLDWSVTNDGTPAPIAGASRSELAAVLDNLDEDAFDEIYAAVAAHRKAMIAEREAQKKSQGGTPTSAVTSPSSSAPASAPSKSEPSTSTTTTSS
jgi:hypothetical protein